MKKIAILGSTGSIGTQTLEIVREQKDICVRALAAGNNIDLLEQQIREFHPVLASVQSEEKAADLRQRLRDMDIKIVSGMDGLIEVATEPQAEILVTAVVGMLGLRPTVEAIKAKKTIALANKETLVTAGHLIMPLAKECGVPILPVDSEHSAIFQSLNGERQNRIAKILLTASGGPFRGKKREELEQVITVDSATLVNKGLEVMEAKWLFGVELEQIQVVVHPQSVIHSMVEYEDGAVIAQLGTPDMRLPIQYALYYPNRRSLSGKRLNFYELGSLTFEEPDMETFQGLSLAMKAMKAGGNMPTVFNAANERAVAMFLEKKIGFWNIPEIIEASMEHIDFQEHPDLEKILSTEQEVYEYIESRWKP